MVPGASMKEMEVYLYQRTIDLFACREPVAGRSRPDSPGQRVESHVHDGRLRGEEQRAHHLRGGK